MADIMAGILKWDDFKWSQEAQSFEAFRNLENTAFALYKQSVTTSGKQRWICAQFHKEGNRKQRARKGG